MKALNNFDFFIDSGWDLLFPGDEEKDFECHNCRRLIHGNEQVEWVDKRNQIFKCPGCRESYEILDQNPSTIRGYSFDPIVL